MRLADLDPRWIEEDGRRIGFIFKSPTKAGIYQSCFLASPERRVQWDHFKRLIGDERTESGHRVIVQGCTEGTHWTIDGEFENLTVAPSIDGSAGGTWHGFIRNGEIVTV